MTVRVFDTMLGKTFSSVENRADEELVFVDAVTEQAHVFYHSQDCCENVRIEDIVGELSDLVGAPLLEACEVSSDDAAPPENAASYTWTFYRFSTVKGTVTVRWLGTSNGCYSEGVDYATK